MSLADREVVRGTHLGRNIRGTVWVMLSLRS